MSTNLMVIVALLIGVLAGWWLTVAQVVHHEQELTLATVEDLLDYPNRPSLALPELPEGIRIQKVRLPSSDLYVVLRGLSEQEHASFMIRAVGYEVLEKEMIAAAFITPQATESDVSGFSPELLLYLKTKINELSGFDVFSNDLE